MTIAVDGTGFLQASSALEEANHLAAVCYDTLADDLQSYGAMAGDAAIADEFAASYDEAADGCLSALVDVVTSLANLGDLTLATVENHRRGEEGSVLGRQIHVDGSLPDAGHVSVVPRSVPSSLGGDAAGLPDWANVVLDHVEGFLWPDADTDRLREAARTWRTVFQVDTIASFCDLAAEGLWLERSPEVPAAVAATEDLAATVRRLGDQLESIATACETYADQVEAQREAILDLVRDLIRDAAIIQGVGIVIGVFTAGGAAGAALAANAAKFAAAAPRFMRIIATLRTLASTTAGTIRSAATNVSFLKVRLARFVGAKGVLRTRFGVAGAVSPVRPSGWLRLAESRGGHTLSRHVGKTDEELLKRFLGRRPPPLSSTFPDEKTAEGAIDSVLRWNERKIDDWLRSGDRKLELEGDLGRTIGKTMDRFGNEDWVSRTRVVIVRDATEPDGYSLLTAFPKA